MQNKGFVKVIAVLLALICLFYLSFSIVSSYYKSKAEEMYGEGTPEYQAYLDSMSSEKVLFWTYTLKECRENELNLGLDLKGGMNVVMEVSVADILKSLAGNSSTSEPFVNAMNLAKQKQLTNQRDFVDLYREAFNEVNQGERLATVFSTFELKDKIDASSSDDNVVKVERGFHEVVDRTELDVVYLARCENWNAIDGYGYVKEALKENRDVAGIMCGNDDIATQAFRALSEERLAGKVMLTGQDGDLSACQRVVAGTQLVTVFKSIDEEARRAAECAVRMAQGEVLEDVDQTMNDGTYDVPYLELTPIAVTQNNIDEVIVEGGFHARDEIYLNR